MLKLSKWKPQAGRDLNPETRNQKTRTYYLPLLYQIEPGEL